MMAVPRRSQRAADEEAHTHVNGKLEPSVAEAEAREIEPEVPEAVPAPVIAEDQDPEPETTRLPVLADGAARAASSEIGRAHV